MKTQSITLCVYAVFILIGGLIGFFAAGSLASLISGTISAIILFACSYFLWRDVVVAYDITIGVLCFLLTFFCYRYVVTHKIMPSGMLFLITTFLLIYLGRTRPGKILPKE